jgi:hypothetical protein
MFRHARFFASLALPRLSNLECVLKKRNDKYPPRVLRLVERLYILHLIRHQRLLSYGRRLTRKLALIDQLMKEYLRRLPQPIRGVAKHSRGRRLDVFLHRPRG